MDTANTVTQSPALERALALSLRAGTVLLALLVWLGSASASVPEHGADVRFQRITVGEQLEEHESINAITRIVQDHSGYLWFAGENGLARYNGVFAEVFQHSATLPSSLGGNYVWDVLVDHSGVLWAATSQGLNRFDEAGHSFVRYTQRQHGPGVVAENALPEDVIFCLALGKDNSLWLGTQQGLVRFDPARRRFRLVAALGNLRIRSLLAGHDGELWVGTFDQGLLRLDIASQTLTRWRHNPTDPHSLPHNHVSSIAAAPDGAIWVGTLGGGIARLAGADRFVTYRHDPAASASLSSDVIWDLHFDRQGVLWVATDSGGLALLAPGANQFASLRHKPFNLTSLSSDKVRAVYEDALGDVWVGAFPEGVNYYDRSTSAFANFTAEPANPNAISHNAILTMFEDSRGRLWMGTEDGLNEFDRELGHFRSHRAELGTPGRLQADSVLALDEDATGGLWVGTWSGGAHRWNPQTGEFVHYGADAANPASLGDDYVWSILRDSSDRLWVGTQFTGLHLYDPASDGFRIFRPNPEDPDSLSYEHVWTLLEDRKGRLWVGTIDGLDRLDNLTATGARFTHFRHDPDNPETMSGNRIVSLFEDSRGAIWVGTNDAGLNRLDPATGKVRRFGFAEGLPSSYIASIIEDDSNQLWLTTVKGIAVLNLSTYDIKTFSTADGLVSNNFNRDATFKDSAGRLYFGSSNGLSIYNPAIERTRSDPPPLVLAELRIVNQVVRAGDGSGTLEHSLDNTQTLRLSHRDAMFAFEFYALSYRTPHRNQYAYRLEGFDKTWNYVGNQSQATYTNIDPGTYTFHVRAANSDGVWNNEGRRLRIVITPPPWATPWAFLFYAAATGALAWAAVIWRRRRSAFAEQQAVNAKLVRLDRLKDAFLANTSHELRTPLNGIIGLAESMLDGTAGPLNEAASHRLKMIAQSGRRLSHLINDILDHAKLTESTLDLRVVPVALRQAVVMVLELAAPLVGKKALMLDNQVPPEAVVLADENRLQQILLNLVGNAIKFTHAGSVSVSALPGPGVWRISVRDTGIGIDAEHLQRIFTAFTQLDAPDTREQGGTGLGLAITKQLVELQGGRIDVRSAPARGAEFTLTLPAAETLVGNEAHPGHEQTQEMRSGEARGDTVLVVDDDAVNRMVIRSQLQQAGFNVLEAEGGADALALLQDNSVALVILDVMMPKMSGYEVCRRLRLRFPVERLPVLFLTAKSLTDELVTGLVAGGNSFLTKPVQKQQLFTRVQRLIKATPAPVSTAEAATRQAHPTGHDPGELLLQLMHSGESLEVILASVSRELLRLTGGEVALYFRHDGDAHCLLEYQFGASGEPNQKPKTRYRVVNKLLPREFWQLTRTVAFAEANRQGALEALSSSGQGLCASLLVPVFFADRAHGCWLLTLGHAADDKTSETLNRLRAHAVASAIKAYGVEAPL